MKVVILGLAPRSFEHPEGWEVWCINSPRGLSIDRWHRLFQLHGRQHVVDKMPEVVEFMASKNWSELGRHVYVPHLSAYPSPCGFEEFPVDRVREAAGDYFTNSFPLVLAFAVLEGATEIMLDGVMWAEGAGQWGASEGWAVPCIEYHIGRARALGVKVTVPPGCGLFRHSEFIYGFEGPGSV